MMEDPRGGMESCEVCVDYSTEWPNVERPSELNKNGLTGVRDEVGVEL